MKTSVVVTLIICGTFIVALPTLSSHMHDRLIAHVLANQGNASPLLPYVGPGQLLQHAWSLSCWLLGAAMIFAAARAALPTIRSGAASDRAAATTPTDV